MPWGEPRFLDIDERVFPSFLPNNLCGDGEGRFAFAHGERVQCTRRSCKKQGRNDFTLALKSDDIQIMQVFFWRSVPKYPRPLLVLITDSPSVASGSPTLQVWDTRSGRGTRVFNVQLGTKETGEVEFGRGLGNSQGADGTNTLYAGLSTGDVCSFQVRKGTLDRVCTLKGLSTAISCIAGDKQMSDYVSAGDESGNIVVWMRRESEWIPVYRFKDAEEDYCSSLGLRGNLLIAGHVSGRVTFHDIGLGEKLADITTNSKAITCLDVHPSKGLILVAGEDCRAAVLELPSSGGDQLEVILSLRLNAVILGGSFTCSRPDFPDITFLMYERSHLVQYDTVDE